jgi:hypothetical protein
VAHVEPDSVAKNVAGYEITAGGALLKGGAVAAGSLVGLVVTSYLARDLSVFDLGYSLYRFAALFFLFTAVAGAGFALRGLIVGSRAHYLYAGGLVHRRRGGPLAVAWPEVELLKGVYDRRQGSEGRVIGYQVHTAGRPAFLVPLVLTGGRDAFLDGIIEQLRAHGRPIQ